MEVRERNRVPIGFKDLFRKFVEPNEQISAEQKIDLASIMKELDKKRISDLEKFTDPTRSGKTNKGGRRRKAGGRDVPTVNTKSVKAKGTSTREQIGEER